MPYSNFPKTLAITLCFISTSGTAYAEPEIEAIQPVATAETQAPEIEAITPSQSGPQPEPQDQPVTESPDADAPTATMSTDTDEEMETGTEAEAAAAPTPQPAQTESEPQPTSQAPQSQAQPASAKASAPTEAEAEAKTLAASKASVVETPLAEISTATPEPEKELTGRDIAQKMDRAQHVQDATRVSSMLIERRGQQLRRKMLMRAKRYGVDERSVIRFEEPADVRDTQYLSWVYDDPLKDDDLWVYFPSENTTRRISGGGKKGAFMRSDFANEDIEARAVDDDTHVLLEESEFDGKPVYVIESTPISIKAKDSSYSKRKIWVDKTIWLPLRVEFYDKRGKLLKNMLYGGIKEIDGVWTATKLIMETPRKKSRTLMQYHDVTYNSGLGDDLFNQSTLKR